VGEREYDQSQSTLDWYVVDARGGEPIRTGAFEVLRRAGIEGVPIPGAWTGEGGTVVFTMYGQGTSNVWKVAISTATGHVAGEPAALTFGTAIERSPAVSSSGQIVFASVTENIDVWRLPLDAESGLASGAIERVTDNAADDRLANLSDDGRTMAFMSSRTGQEGVWLRDVQGGGDRQVTHDTPGQARISRDGSTLAVPRGGSDTAGTDRLSLTDGLRSRLCDNCGPGDWSPDGTRLIVQQGRPSRLVMRDLGSSRERELAAHSESYLLQPRFSDDGQWIVFHTAINPTLRQIYAIPAFSDSSIPVEAWIPVVVDFGVHPSWARDGSAVYYFSLRDGAFCAWLQPVDRETKRPIDNPVAVQHFHQARLRAAAGAGASNHIVAGYLYVTLTSSAANIWMLDR